MYVNMYVYVLYIHIFYHNWTALHFHKNQPYASNKTYEATLPSVTTQASQVCRDVDRCVGVGVSCRALSEKSMDIPPELWFAKRQSWTHTS